MAIKAMEAIRIGRSLLGRSYSEMDCIGFIRAIIQRGAGGDPKYRCEGTNWLWDSIKNSGKYQHLTWRQEGIQGARPGMLTLMRDGADDESHVGLVTERGTVLHSSKSRGGVVETEFNERNGWNLLAIHRHILPGEVETEEPEIVPDVENEPMDLSSVYMVNASGGVRMREKAGEKYAYMQTVPDGTCLVIQRVINGYAQTDYNGHTGWVSTAYLVPAHSGILSPEVEDVVQDIPATENSGYTGAITVSRTELEGLKAVLTEALERVNVALMGGVD